MPSTKLSWDSFLKLLVKILSLKSKPFQSSVQVPDTVPGVSVMMSHVPVESYNPIWERNMHTINHNAVRWRSQQR